MNVERRPLWLYWAVVALFAVLLGWWVFFFSKQGALLIERVSDAGAPLDPEQALALSAATRESMTMFLFEGTFVFLTLLVGMFLVLRAVRRQAELQRRQHEFLSAVTHELRSPIASACLYIESLMLGRVDEKKRDRYLKNTHEDLKRLQDMVDSLLESARIASRRVEVHPEPMDLSAFLDDVRAELVTENSMNGACLEFKTAEPVPVLADPEALGTILRNLVSNAVKYGGRHPRICVSAHRDGRDGVLEVRDYGPGLRGASKKRIFAAFERGPSEDIATLPGPGLGLFMVAELARALGGRAWADDNLPDGGTSMCVALPGQEV